MRKIAATVIVCFLACSIVCAQAPVIDVQHYDFGITLNDANNVIQGQAVIKIKFLADVRSFALGLVKKNGTGKGMKVTSVIEAGNRLAFAQDSDKVKINITAKINSIHSFTVNYEGIPADGLIISTNKFGHRTFFGDNWPNRAHNWLPCADLPGDKASVDFIVTAPCHYQVVSNGLKTEEKELPNHLKITHWHEAAQLPTKVMVIGVAEFAIDNAGDAGGVPVYTYVFPENKEDGFKNYAVAKQVLPFYIKNVGPYAYKKLANVQSKTIFGGMENAGAIFYFENSVTDRGIEELMAHEIAHQWFGDAASEKNFGHIWLSEGFATYMTNLYLESKYGTDTLKKRLSADREKVFGFEKRRLTPIVDTAVISNYMQLLNANSYEKGGWVLHMLRRKLGDKLFWKGIQNYYAKYNGGNAYTSGFQAEMEKASGQDLKQFFQQWLYTAGHPKLAITYSYDADKKGMAIEIEQKQDVSYEFSLEVDLDGKVFTINITGGDTSVMIPLSEKPAVVQIDPNVNLLAEFQVNK